jgi:predicted outer membrane repeat protein
MLDMKPNAQSTSSRPDHDFSIIEVLESRIAPATFTVINTNDSGTGSLRAELALADASPGPNTIVFHLPAPMAHSASILTLTSGALTSTGDVTIKGPGAGKLIIDGGGKYSGFYFIDHTTNVDRSVTISGLSVEHCSAIHIYGGGIYSTESLTLKNVVISGNTADTAGGVWVNGNSGAGGAKSLTISNSLITGNQATGTKPTYDGDGGGVNVYALKSVSISNTVVTGNTSATGGGGIYARLNGDGTGIKITGCEIAGNSAPYGGGLWLGDNNVAPASKMTISGTRITGNTASASKAGAGGGLAVFYGSTVITGSTIENNTALYYGGGIDAFNLTSLTISKSTISGNQTTAAGKIISGGGGLFINVSGASVPAKITGSHITNNQSAYSGGGIQAVYGVKLTVSSSTISGNVASQWGGGISTYGQGAAKVSLSVAGATLSGNTGKYGGGIATYPSGTPGFTGPVSIISSKITGNESTGGGGGLSIAGASSLTVTNCTVTGNTGPRAGGIGMYFVESFHISGGSVTGNSAATYAGGIECYTSTGSILGTTISGNAAGTKGGGVWDNSSGTVTLQIAKVTGNTAPTGPNVYGTFTFV